MRRFQALLIMAGLVAAPAGAAAGPSPAHNHDVRTTDSTEWSGKGHLGITVIGLTPELRTHFGATAGSGVLVRHVDREPQDDVW